MKNLIEQIKKLSDDQLIIFDLIINIYPLAGIHESLNKENIDIKFNITDYDTLNKIKKLSREFIKLRNIEII